MQTQSMPNMRQMAIEDKLTELWRTLPLRGVTDGPGVLADYLFALSDCSVNAIENTVDALRAGLIEDASKDYCPKAPKLAEYARAEQRRLEAINRPKMVSCMPVHQGYRDMRIIQRQTVNELAAQGWVCVAKNMNGEKFVQQARQLPIRTRHYWAIEEAWSPS